MESKRDPRWHFVDRFMNMDTNFSIEYLQIEFKNTSKIPFTVIKLASFQGRRNGST